ncbi:pantetheine-phosphate adenylyltransferase [Myxococcota bacterium]|nr:pantetheine-phosphate adenylyltransferase [Myxococcota bacterium]
MAEGRLAIYPGSFDPPHLGHVNVIARALAAFDRVLVAVVGNPEKRSLFTPAERMEMIRESVGDHPNLDVDQFDGLLVDYVRARGARTIVRGLRAVQDFEFELQMAGMNRKLAPEVDTLFMMTDADWFFVSSRMVREVASLGGDVSQMVAPSVLARLHRRLAER